MQTNQIDPKIFSQNQYQDPENYNLNCQANKNNQYLQQMLGSSQYGDQKEQSQILKSLDQSENSEQQKNFQAENQSLKNAIKVKREDFRVQIRKQKYQLQLTQKRKQQMNKGQNKQNYREQLDPKYSKMVENYQQFLQNNSGESQMQFDNEYSQYQQPEQYQNLKKNCKFITQEVEEHVIELYQDLMVAIQTQDMAKIQGLLEILFEFSLIHPVSLKSSTELIIKCRFLDVFEQILKNKSLLQEYPYMFAKTIAIISNICSIDDKYVDEVVNHSGDFIELLISILEEAIDVKEFNLFFSNYAKVINGTQQYDKNQLQAQVSKKLVQQQEFFKIAEGCIFAFANMVSGQEKAKVMQIKSNLINSNIVELMEQTFSNLQCYIDEYQQLLNNFLREENQGNQNQLKFLSGHDEQSIQDFYSTFTWFIASMAKQPSLKKWNHLLDKFRATLIIIFDIFTQNCQNSQVLAHCIWGFTSLMGKDDFYIKSFCEALEPKRLKVLVQIIKSQDPMLVFQSIKLVNSILSGEDQQISILIDLGLFDAYTECMDINHQQLLGEIYYGISNLCATCPMLLDKFLKHKIFKKLMHKGVYEKDFKLKREIYLAIGNLLYSAENNQIQEILMNDMEYVEQVMEGLKLNDQSVVINMMDGIENCLDKFKDVYTYNRMNIMATQFERFGFSNLLQELQMSQNDNIAAKANLIVEKYFVDTELEDDKNKIYNDNEDMLF